MMRLISTNDPRETHTFLYGKKYKVGRRDADLSFPDDHTISKFHAEIEVEFHRANMTYPGLQPTLNVTDVGSKHGTFVNYNPAEYQELVEASMREPQCLAHGARVRFGKNCNQFKVEYTPLVVMTSTLDDEENANLKEIILKLSGHFLFTWSPECNFVVMPEVTLTSKALAGLVSGCLLVTPDYFTELLKSVEEKLPPPLPRNYEPPFMETGVPFGEINLQPLPARKNIFVGKTFLFVTKSQVKTLGFLVESGGGKVQMLKQSTSAIIKHPETILYEPPDTKDYVYQVIENTFIDEYKRSGKRVIVGREISFAVLRASTSTYCNPRTPRSPPINVYAQHAAGRHMTATRPSDISHSLPHPSDQQRNASKITANGGPVGRSSHVTHTHVSNGNERSHSSIKRQSKEDNIPYAKRRRSIEEINVYTERYSGIVTEPGRHEDKSREYNNKSLQADHHTTRERLNSVDNSRDSRKESFHAGDRTRTTDDFRHRPGTHSASTARNRQPASPSQSRSEINTDEKDTNVYTDRKYDPGAEKQKHEGNSSSYNDNRYRANEYGRNDSRSYADRQSSENKDAGYTGSTTADCTRRPNTASSFTAQNRPPTPPPQPHPEIIRDQEDTSVYTDRKYYPDVEVERRRHEDHSRDDNDRRYNDDDYRRYENRSYANDYRQSSEKNYADYRTSTTEVLGHRPHAPSESIVRNQSPMPPPVTTPAIITDTKATNTKNKYNTVSERRDHEDNARCYSGSKCNADEYGKNDRHNYEGDCNKSSKKNDAGYSTRTTECLTDRRRPATPSTSNDRNCQSTPLPPPPCPEIITNEASASESPSTGNYVVYDYGRASSVPCIEANAREESGETLEYVRRGRLRIEVTEYVPSGNRDSNDAKKI